MARYYSQAVVLGILILAVNIDWEAVAKGQLRKRDVLSIKEAAAIRNIVYNSEITIYTDNTNLPVPVRGVEIPQVLAELHKKKPVATLGLLQIIVRGASPQDAKRAGTLAYSLLKGPEAGAAFHKSSIEHFDEEDSDGRTKRGWMTEVLESLTKDLQPSQ